MRIIIDTASNGCIMTIVEQSPSNIPMGTGVVNTNSTFIYSDETVFQNAQAKLSEFRSTQSN